jgi:hypothetical protein
MFRKIDTNVGYGSKRKRFFTIQTLNRNENFIVMENRVKVPVFAIGIPFVYF